MAEVTTDSTTEEELETDELDEEVDQETEDETDESDDQSTDEETEETDDESEENTDDEEDSDEDDSEFEKRFTQFKGEDLPEYTKNLEDGYAESSKEAVRLSRENKELKATVDRVNQLIATNPDLAKALQAGEGQDTVKTVPKDPAIAFAEAQMKKTWEKEYQEFSQQHPEIETDPQLAEALNAKLSIAKRIVEEEEGRLVGMGEGLEMAWKLLGRDTDDKQEKVRVAAKDSASQGKASGGKKKEAKSKFSESQISVAMDMMGVDRNEAIKRMSEHVK